MGTYATTDKGNVDITTSGAFVKIQWTDTVLRVRAFNPRYLIAGIDDRTMWILALTERQSAPPNQPFSTEISMTFAPGVNLLTAGNDFMTACATALLAGGGP